MTIQKCYPRCCRNLNHFFHPEYRKAKPTAISFLLSVFCVKNCFEPVSAKNMHMLIKTVS